MRGVVLLLALASLPLSMPTVAPGIDVLVQSGLGGLAGRRIGLVTHDAAVDRERRRTVELLAARTTVAALLAVEHGLAANGPAGAPLGDGRDAATGLPVRSIYPEVKAAALDGIDLVVVDLQDAGVRPYTYPWTVVRLLRAAAARRVPVIVLDRPDPQGGERVEGPVQAERSLLGEHPVPITYGMTIGELLRMVNAEEPVGADLTVVPMRGWRRGMTWTETGLPWIPPSPNLPDPETLRLFAAVGLLEGTSLSDGVGWRPFRAAGAPGLDAVRLAAALRARHLPGVRFDAVTFTPTSGLYAGSRCGGVALALTDARIFRPVATALHLLDAASRIQPLAFTPAFDRLWGTSRVREAIELHRDIGALLASFEAEVARFRTVRARYLLYP